MDTDHHEAVGVLGKDAARRLAMTRVALRPQVTFGGSNAPGDEELRRLHDQAHHACFIANSVKTEVIVEPQGVAGVGTDRRGQRPRRPGDKTGGA